MLTQLREERNIFELRNEFNKEKVEVVNEYKVFMAIADSLGLVYNVQDIISEEFVDQDGYKHLVFKRKGRELDKASLREFYNTVYGTGSICRNTSDLMYQKDCLKYTLKHEPKLEIDLMTVISILKCAMYGSDLSVMVSLQHWLHSATK